MASVQLFLIVIFSSLSHVAERWIWIWLEFHKFKNPRKSLIFFSFSPSPSEIICLHSLEVSTCFLPQLSKALCFLRVQLCLFPSLLFSSFHGRAHLDFKNSSLYCWAKNCKPLTPWWAHSGNLVFFHGKKSMFLNKNCCGTFLGYPHKKFNRYDAGVSFYWELLKRATISKPKFSLKCNFAPCRSAPLESSYMSFHAVNIFFTWKCYQRVPVI